MTDNHLAIVAATSSSAKMQFQKLTLSNTLSAFYYYIVQYGLKDSTFTHSIVLPHEVEGSYELVTIEGLRSQSDYNIRVTPYRKDNVSGTEEAGWPTGEVSFKTGRNRYIMVYMYFNAINIRARHCK
jgi:hypothetical protein